MPHTEKGGALLTALFIMTLVAIVATAMSIRLQTDVYRTRLTITHDKLYLASQALTFWAMDELSQTNKSHAKVLDQGYIALFPKTMENLDKGILVSGGLYDLQALFNINNMLDKKAEPGFINFISMALPQLPSAERNNLALALRNWLSPFDPIQFSEANIAYYTKQSPPYYPGNQLMQSRSEFRLLQNINAQQYLSLEPFITALPDSKTPININTASKQVLMSLGANLTEDKANELIATRKEEGIKNINEVSLILAKHNISNDLITLESSYFLSVAHVKSEDFYLDVYCVLKRTKDKNNKVNVTIVRESLNGF